MIVIPSEGITRRDCAQILPHGRVRGVVNFDNTIYAKLIGKIRGLGQGIKIGSSPIASVVILTQ